MFGQARTKNDGREARPLLGTNDDDDPNLVFSAPDGFGSDGDDDDDGEEEYIPHSALSGPRSVRFQEEPQILGPPLRSTIASREARACLFWLSRPPG